MSFPKVMGPTMSVERSFVANLAGFNAEVIRPRADDAGGVGVATFAIQDEKTAQPLFGLALRHADGTMLAGLLPEELVHQLADAMADFVQALPAFQSQARH